MYVCILHIFSILLCYTHTHTHTHTHSLTHTYTHTNTHTQTHKRLRSYDTSVRGLKLLVSGALSCMHRHQRLSTRTTHRLLLDTYICHNRY
jgi:hypothetical protein